MENFTIADSIPLRYNRGTISILFTANFAVFAAGLVGNILVIIIVMKTQRMKTATNYFVVNLAIADLLVLIVCLPPTLISNIYVPWVMGLLLCKAVSYTQGASVCASVYSLAAISGVRWLAIWHPLRRHVTKSVARMIILSIWIWAAVLALPWLLYFDLSEGDESEPSLVFCTESWPPGIYENIYFVLVNLGLFYLVPLIFISFCHLSIWLRVRHRNVPTDSSESQMELVHQRTRASLQKMIIMIVAAFAACRLPLYVIFIRIKLIPVELGATEERVLEYALPIAQLLGASNSCINPILYAFFSQNFRLGLRRLLRGSAPCTTPWNCPNRHLHNQTNPEAGCATNLIRLRITHNQVCQRKRQLSNSLDNAADSGESMLGPKNIEFAGIFRSKSCQF